MNQTQAQLILGACPPGPWPLDDPQVAEALRLAESDPGLARWLAETRGFDTAVAAKLRAVAPPADLRDAILAGRRVTSVDGRRAFWRRPALLAWAAMLVLLVGISTVWLGSPRTGAGAFRQDVAQFLTEDWQHDFDFAETRFPAIQEWLARQPGAIQLAVPARLAGSTTYGCKVFDWRGQRATIVCFLAKDEGEIIHIVSVDRSALPATEIPVPATAPQFARAGEWNTAMWSQGNRQYVAFTTLNREGLARYVKPAAL
jgi:hypothetical protein